jgi:hypothetical protein
MESRIEMGQHERGVPKVMSTVMCELTRLVDLGESPLAIRPSVCARKLRIGTLSLFDRPGQVAD